jgi:hypothetical protein
MEYENWLTRKQVSKALDVSGEYVRKLTVAGRLTFVNTPLGRLYSPEGVADAKAQGIGQRRARV